MFDVRNDFLAILVALNISATLAVAWAILRPNRKDWLKNHLIRQNYCVTELISADVPRKELEFLFVNELMLRDELREIQAKILALETEALFVERYEDLWFEIFRSHEGISEALRERLRKVWRNRGEWGEKIVDKLLSLMNGMISSAIGGGSSKKA